MMTEYKQTNGWLNSTKSFQFLSDGNDNVLNVPHDDLLGPQPNPPFSPQKRYSEVTEGGRQIANIKPIILCGGKGN